MDITPPRDGLAAEELKGANRQRPVHEAEHVAPAPRLARSDQPREGGRAPPSGHRPVQRSGGPPDGVERRSGRDRRQGERRQSEREVPFDTRSPHERRTHLRRREDLEHAAEMARRRGIDLEA